MASYERRHGHERTHKANGSKKRDQHRQEAESRNVIRNKRSPEEQLLRLDNLLGKGTGAVKERTRLQKAIADQKR